MFRIALAVVLLVDLAIRARFLQANYAASGAMPAPLLAAMPPFYSLHGLSGSVAWQALLFAVAALFAVLLLVGWRTRWVAFGCWLLLVSLQYHNVLLLDGGDRMLRMLLLWSLFLPLGARLSLDARRMGRPETSAASVLSPASAALLLQLAILYFFGGIAKSGPEWHVTGTAIEMALGASYWARPLGQELLAYPELLRLASPATVYWEIAAPLLLFVPRYTVAFRLLLLPTFWLFQLGLCVSIHLNLFPWISTLATLPFLPGRLWDRLGWRPHAAEQAEGDAPANLAASRPLGVGGRAAQGLVVLLLVYGIATSLYAQEALRLPPGLVRLGQTLGVAQRFTMYGPNPPRHDHAIELRGVRADASTLDLLDGPGRAAMLGRIHRSYRFKYYLERTVIGPPSKAAAIRRAYLDWVCREWNARADADQQVEQVRLRVAKTRTEPARRGLPPRFLSHEQVCEPPP